MSVLLPIVTLTNLTKPLIGRLIADRGSMLLANSEYPVALTLVWHVLAHLAAPVDLTELLEETLAALDDKVVVRRYDNV